MLDIGTELDGGDITFGSLADGIVVAQRHPGVWSVSFRPNPDGIGIRYYTAPAVVARVVIAREHDETAAAAPPNRGRVGADGRPVSRHRLRRDHGRTRRAVLGSVSATTG